MILRSYQDDIVNRAIESLSKNKEALIVSPTGSGKSLIIKSILEKLEGRSLVLSYSIEITLQLRNLLIGTTVRTVQAALGDSKNCTLEKYETLVLDEAHHCLAPGFLEVLAYLRALNPELKLLGVTATPSRSDRESLAKVFKTPPISVNSNDLMEEGFLVKPKIFAIPKLLEESCLSIPCGEIINEWLARAKGRKTIIFTSSLLGAKTLSRMFNDEGISSEVVHGSMKSEESKEIIRKYKETPDPLILCNVRKLTEGFDAPLTSCIVIVVKTPFKGAYLQMIGRGLRLHEDKEDCLILDFGEGGLKHADSILQNYELDPLERRKGESGFEFKSCRFCFAVIPSRSTVCPECGEFIGSKKKELTEFEMVLMSLCDDPPVLYKKNEDLVIYSDANKSVFIVRDKKDIWHAIRNGVDIQTSGSFKEVIEKIRNYFTISKSSSLLRDAASDKQIGFLKDRGIDASKLNKFEASCEIAYHYKRYDINAELKRKLISCNNL